MRRLLLSLLAAGFLLAPASAQAQFGVNDLDLTFTEADGSAATQAGAHPFAATNVFAIDSAEDETLGITVPSGDIKDFTASLPPGLVADRDATPKCTMAEFRPPIGDPICARATVIGTARVELGVGGFVDTLLYNLVPPPGILARIGLVPNGAPLTVDLGLSTYPPYNGYARLTSAPQIFPVFSSRFTLWGVPADPAHDAERGGPVEGDRRPYLTLPRSCTGPLLSSFEVTSWQGETFNETIESHGDAGEPLGMTGCERLGFSPSITATPTAKAASSSSGLDFALDVEDENLTSPDAEAGSDIKKAVVTLPAGMTVNPSQAEGLEVCSQADLANETLQAEAGEGCPNASKIGTIEVESPLLEDQILRGSLFVAEPYQNPFGTLLALYIVIKDRDLGILVTQPARVDLDPETGQLTTTTEDMPQLPFSHFRLHFREGARSPLATPPSCGTHEVKALLYPWAGGPPVESTSAFEILTGPNEGHCPTAGQPPFRPGLSAGTLSNRAGSFSPFNLRLSRSDSEQEFTRFAIKLPPGIAGILAGIPKCPDAAIEAAKGRTGTEELASPSCPTASEVGRSLAGAGVGPALAYAPGKIYLAGSYEGAPISIAAITAAKVGPFDVGTVVIRQGFKIDPRTAEVFLDPVGSDPIPHIIDGIVVHARDIRAYADRPNFVFNPTGCEPTSTASTVLGSGLDFASAADDNPVVVSSRFQAADCASLRFKPKLDLRLIGATKRGGHPKFRANLRMNRSEANIAHARVTLPRSAFLDQSHIRTVCTRVQFAQKQCPAGSVYGYAKAITPILDAPIEGPVYLRSSEHKLPDLVAALRSQEGIEFELIGRVDSLKGRIRNTFEIVPDAPVDSFTLTMQGGAKGLIVNSTNLCTGRHRAVAEFDAHNGRVRDWRPEVGARCSGKGRKGKRGAG
jgi:hypothetical protein